MFCVLLLVDLEKLCKMTFELSSHKSASTEPLFWSVDDHKDSDVYNVDEGVVNVNCEKDVDYS